MLGNDDFQVLNEFLGFGDINSANIWFFGIEEGQTWDEKSKRDAATF